MASRAYRWGRFFPQICCRLDSQTEIVLYHHIGEQVVAGDAAVLVGALAEQQVCLACFGAIGVTADPETGGLHQYFRSFVEIKGLVAGFLAVGIQGKSYICGDMDLAAANVPGPHTARCHPELPSTGNGLRRCSFSGSVLLRQGGSGPGMHRDSGRLPGRFPERRAA